MKRTGHPKREDGYTMIFNELLEALMCADIPKRARRLIDVQMRFSFGCGPKSFTSLTKGNSPPWRISTGRIRTALWGGYWRNGFSSVTKRK